MTTTIFSARRIITMNPSQPEATQVAVRAGRILGAGSLDELQGQSLRAEALQAQGPILGWGFDPIYFGA